MSDKTSGGQLKHLWNEEELELQWGLLPQELKLLRNKTGSTRLGFAVLLKFFQVEWRFPEEPSEVPWEVIQFIAGQLVIPKEVWWDYPWEGRAIMYHRAEIRNWLGFRKASWKDVHALKAWLVKEKLDQEHHMDRLREIVLERCHALLIEPPAPEQVRRLIRAALQEHETRFCEDIFKRLTSSAKKSMDALLQSQPAEDDSVELTPWQTLKSEPGKAGLDSVKEAASRLNLVREVGLPVDLLNGVPPKLLERYAKRAAVEESFELRRHAEPLRATLLTAFLRRRSEDLTDHLVDLLVETVHKMGKRAERRIDDGLVEELQKAPSKMAKLYRMAKASVDTPKGVVEEVIFPAAPEKWLITLIQEVESRSGYKGKVRMALQRSYRAHYRRMLPELLNNLEFRCTNTQHQPVMQALKVLKTNLTHKSPTYPKGVQVPLKGVVPSNWIPLVVEEECNPPKINRITYEICVLKALREQLRCREIWVVGSRRFRDPEEDLPRDFEDRKAAYYENLGIPLDAKAFTASIREEMTRHLKALDEGMPTNPKVKIIPKKDGYQISISPSEPQVEPENLTKLKLEVNNRWSGTSLLDVLKETDLRVNFTQWFRSGTERSHLWTKQPSSEGSYSVSSAWVPTPASRAWNPCRMTTSRTCFTFEGAFFPLKDYVRLFPKW